MPSTIDSIVEGFPFPTVTPIVGEPNYESIAALHLQLNANAASIHSHLGDGRLGLLHLTISPAVYATLSDVAFVPPVNPGPVPLFEDGLTGPQIANVRLEFAENTALYKRYDTADKALKQLLLSAVDDMFVRCLQTQYIGYLNVTTRAILDHLYAEYARISPSDILANDATFKTAYDPNMPIETLFDQIESAIDYAAAGLTPYTPEQVINNAYQLVYATGMFLDDCKIWKRRDAPYKTWAHFKTDFSLAHREFRDARSTTAGATDYRSNNVTYQQDTIDAIACLATATASDRHTVAVLTETNSALTKELAIVNAKLVTALLANSRLAVPSATSSDSRMDARHYCWSCGYQCLHYSSRCPCPKEGHQKGAKASNIMGGSTANKP
jgi:hypothetical protein